MTGRGNLLPICQAATFANPASGRCVLGWVMSGSTPTSCSTTRSTGSTVRPTRRILWPKKNLFQCHDLCIHALFAAACQERTLISINAEKTHATLRILTRGSGLQYQQVTKQCAFLQNQRFLPAKPKQVPALTGIIVRRVCLTSLKKTPMTCFTKAITRQALANRQLRKLGLCQRCRKSSPESSRCPDCREHERTRSARFKQRSRTLGRPKSTNL